jgi:hypothetical protein
MEVRKESDDNKIIAALICLFTGFMFVWNITAQISDIYELRLDAETCSRVNLLGLETLPVNPPGLDASEDCRVTAPFRQAGIGVPAGFLVLPDGSEMQISPLDARQTTGSAEWSAAMKTQLVMAMLFWAATLALLFSVYRNRD